MNTSRTDSDRAILIKDRYDKYLSDLAKLKAKKLEIISKYRKKADSVKIEETKQQIRTIFSKESN